MLTQVDEKTERLIVRYLDGALDGEEVREIEALLARDTAARRLLHDYRRIDDDARDVLSRVVIRPLAAAAAGRPHRGMWLATAAGVMAAAATIGLFVFPAGSNDVASGPFPRTPLAELPAPTHGRESRPTFVADEGLSRPAAWQRLTPHRDVLDVQQQWVAVLDPQTQRIYLVRLDQTDAASVPVRYEH